MPDAAAPPKKKGGGSFALDMLKRQLPKAVEPAEESFVQEGGDADAYDQYGNEMDPSERTPSAASRCVIGQRDGLRDSSSSSSFLSSSRAPFQNESSHESVLSS